MACYDWIDPTTRHNNGNRLGCILGRPDQRVRSRYHDDINLETHHLGRKLRVATALPLRISVLDGNVLSVYVAEIAQSPPNCLETGGLTSCIARREIPYPCDFRRLLRLNRKAESQEQNAKCKSKNLLVHRSLLTPNTSPLTPYRITLSALAKTFGGIVRPICLAAFRLMTNSNCFGCSTGRSAGLAPLRILSTYVVARRFKSGV